MKTKDQKPGKIKSAILNWLGFGFADADHWAQWYGRESEAGITVSSDKALTLSSVWACTRLVAQTIATLPVGLYERLPDGSRRLADNLPVARLIHSKPNADMTAVMFWESIIGNALLHGNGFAEKKRSAGRIVALEFLCSERLTWCRKLNGEIEYRYTEIDGKQRIIPEDDIFHVPGFSLNGRFGMSVIKYGVEVFGSALAGNSAANGTFKNGLSQTVAFTIDRVLKPEQRADFRLSVDAISGAMNAGKPAVLEGGMKAETIGINPTDAQLLESRVFSIEEVCRWFGVPPSMIGATDKASSWASSSEQLNLWFLQYGLRPWLKRIEQAIWSSLLTPVEQMKYYAEFSVEGLLRADIAGRTAFYASALQNGYLNRSTVAMLENLPAIPGGDVYTVQSNLIPLDQLGTGVESQAVRAALMHWLKEGEQ
jgi:HK97 family phage portal protein